MMLHDEWLALTPENALEPDLPICDPHHHLWSHTSDKYLAVDFLKDASGGHRLLKTVSIEAFPLYQIFGPKEMTPIGETQFIVDETLNLKSETKIAAGIVGYANLASGSEVEITLESQINAAQGRFRGVRFITAYDESTLFKHPPNPKDIISYPCFREGLSMLQKHGLVFDAWLYFHQIPDIVELAKTFPDLVIVVDHAGGLLGIGPYANKHQQVLEDWKIGITSLSPFQNVFIKFGGLGMEGCGFEWHKRPKPPGSDELSKTMEPYFSHCIESVGVNRCMFESNFPVDKESYSYTVLWNAFKLMTQYLSRNERAALFYDTAAKVYKL